MSTLWLRGRTIAVREANARTKTLATANVERENAREGGKYTVRWVYGCASACTTHVTAVRFGVFKVAILTSLSNASCVLLSDCRQRTREKRRRKDTGESRRKTEHGVRIVAPCGNTRKPITQRSRVPPRSTLVTRDSD